MRPPFIAAAALGLALLAAHSVLAAPPATFTVQPANVADEKAVFATVESRNVVPARTRIGGTIASLAVKDGDEVKKGQVLAVVADEKLLLQRDSLDADIAGLQASLAQAEADFRRAEALVGQGAVSRQQYDRARTALDVAQSALNARIQSRAVIEQQIAEGQVLAPTDGRVLDVPDTAGTVVLPGDSIATIAEHGFVLRLEVPERSARYLHAGDTVRINGTEIGEPSVEFGRITLVYPEIRNGRVEADATAPGLGSYFVGLRVLVWVPTGERPAYIIPEHFIETRFGLDYVRLARAEGSVIAVPIQRGEPHPTPSMPDGIEVLSGIHSGDTLVQP
ncbi:MAG TPA: efflux RND transporter periplasmic adaptor subunit [Acetobacteraceae bacterium]|nr:efflux RND transporter periplasmic adaptor subunit [Acetobacteraceae bacterium]